VQNKAKQQVDEHEAEVASRQRAGSKKGRAAAGEAAATEGAEAANRRADMTVDGEALEAGAAEVPAGATDEGGAAEAERAADEAPAAGGDGDEDAGTAADEASEASDEQDQQEQEPAEPRGDEEEDVPVTAEVAPVHDDGREAAAADGESEAVEAEVIEGEVIERDEAEALAADLASARSEAASYLDDLRRLQADFDNYRKRMLREQTMRVAAASQALVSRLLPVLDNFELAISHAEQSREFDRMLKGVEMVFGELREVLRSEGLSAIEAEGKPFDPSCHEAVVAVEEEGVEPGTVVDVVRTGYEFQGKVLRPAMVKVAK
jgi:molecular chaperone GrpE